MHCFLSLSSSLPLFHTSENINIVGKCFWWCSENLIKYVYRFVSFCIFANVIFDCVSIGRKKASNRRQTAQIMCTSIIELYGLHTDSNWISLNLCNGRELTIGWTLNHTHMQFTDSVVFSAIVSIVLAYSIVNKVPDLRTTQFVWQFFCSVFLNWLIFKSFQPFKAIWT